MLLWAKYCTQLGQLSWGCSQNSISSNIKFLMEAIYWASRWVWVRSISYQWCGPVQAVSIYSVPWIQIEKCRWWKYHLRPNHEQSQEEACLWCCLQCYKQQVAYSNCIRQLRLTLRLRQYKSRKSDSCDVPVGRYVQNPFTVTHFLVCFPYYHKYYAVHVGFYDGVVVWVTGVEGDWVSWGVAAISMVR